MEKTFRISKDAHSVFEILQKLLSKGVIIYSCEDNLKFGGDYVSSTVMAHSFGLVADITEEINSRLTKEALASRKQAGKTLGRPRGRKNTNLKLDAKKEQIQELFKFGKSAPEICRLLNIPRSSLWVYVKEHPEVRELA